MENILDGPAVDVVAPARSQPVRRTAAGERRHGDAADIRLPAVIEVGTMVADQTDAIPIDIRVAVRLRSDRKGVRVSEQVVQRSLHGFDVWVRVDIEMCLGAVHLEGID